HDEPRLNPSDELDGVDPEPRPRGGRLQGGQPIAPAAKILGDSQRVATGRVDERGAELDQALEEVALAWIVGAHPGRLEDLVGIEEVTAVVGLEAGGQCPSP